MEVDGHADNNLVVVYAVHLIPGKLDDKDSEWTAIQNEVQALMRCRIKQKEVICSARVPSRSQPYPGLSPRGKKPQSRLQVPSTKEGG